MRHCTYSFGQTILGSRGSLAPGSHLTRYREKQHACVQTADESWRAARWWHRQISRQQSANLSVAEFCRQLGISVTTFYYWKRRVRKSLAPPGLALAEHPSQHPTAPAGTALANFMPVSILDPGAGTQLEIELTNACMVRLKGASIPFAPPPSPRPASSAAPAKEATDAPSTLRGRPRFPLHQTDGYEKRL